MVASVVAVSRNVKHVFSKINVETIKLCAGLGVEGDAHFGKTVQHLHLIKKDPGRANRRQVLIIASERILEWQSKGYIVQAGSLGENITTKGLDLERLPLGTKLRFENGAMLVSTGLRKPCHQIEKFSRGLLDETISKPTNTHSDPRFLAGIMAIVACDGFVSVGDGIETFHPRKPFQAMGAV